MSYEPETVEAPEPPAAPQAQGTALHDELHQLRERNQELEAANAALDSQLTYQRAQVADAERRRDDAEEQQKQLASRLVDFQTMEKGAEASRWWLPDIPCVDVLDAQNRPTGVRWGKVLVREERDENGDARTPGIVGFRRTISFKDDSAYSRDAIEGRAKGTVDMMLSMGDFVGPLDSRTQQPVFLNFPPLFAKNAEGKEVRCDRVLDVIVLVR